MEKWFKKALNWTMYVVALSFVFFHFCMGAEKTCAFGLEYAEHLSSLAPDSAKCEWLNRGDEKDSFGFEHFPSTNRADGKGLVRRNTSVAPHSKVPQCTRIYLTDFGSEFVTEQDFLKVKEYIYQSVKSCLQEGIGRTILVVPLMHEEKSQMCCNLEECARMLLNMKMSDLVQPYNNTDLLWNKKSFENTWYNEVDYMNSTLLDRDKECPKNSFVIISNRVMDMSLITREEDIPNTYKYFEDEITFYCIRLSIIIVGRPNLSDEQLDSQYMNITKNLFSVSSYDCLATEFTECLMPCSDEDFIQCRKKNLSKCRDPAPIPVPSPVEKFTDDLHVIYVFALSQINATSFLNILNAVKMPLLDYFHSEKGLSVSLIFPETPPGLPWIHSKYDLEEQMQVEYENGFLDVELDKNMTNETSKSTTNMFLLAVDNYLKFFPGFENPDVAESIPPARFVLITDFIEKNFFDTIRTTNNESSNILDKFDFRVHVSNQLTRHYYIAHSLVFGRIDVFNPLDPNLRIPVNDEQVITRLESPKDIKREKLILFIVMISFSASILILIVCTFIYRRKLIWLQKLDRFRARHQADESNNIVVTDFWELSWDKLLIKSEKLGSGAYGQVYRGTIIGKPPCVDHIYSIRPNSFFELDNCDVAVKMLPQYASEKARQEFMFEIEIMKAMGYSENIVNMLGCITVGQTICLALEFCPYKDLLNYVKIVKQDMETVEEAEEKLNHTKDFLLFSWQISDGMRFLHSKGIIHRDLAARNILIDVDRNAKISDFGLCLITNYKSLPVSGSFGNQRNSNKRSVSGRLPIKWLAVECLKHQQFTPQSDVWSFGILLYEMYSFGSAPFEEISALDLLEHLEVGNRPEQPEYCSEEIYDVMQKCWLEKPDERATFQELLTLFTIFLERATEGYGYLSLLKTNTQQYAQLSKLAIAKSFRQENFERQQSRAATDLNLVMTHFNNNIQLPQDGEHNCARWPE